MWVKEREPDLSYKGPFGDGLSRIRVAGGADCLYLPLVGISNSDVALWFELVSINGVVFTNRQLTFNFQHLPGINSGPVAGVNQFDIDAWKHASDSQLKIAILGWRGDADHVRDAWVLRTGFYDRP